MRDLTQNTTLPPNHATPIALPIERQVTRKIDFVFVLLMLVRSSYFIRLVFTNDGVGVGVGLGVGVIRELMT